MSREVRLEQFRNVWTVLQAGRRNWFVAEVVRLPTFRELAARILTNSATTFSRTFAGLL